MPRFTIENVEQLPEHLRAGMRRYIELGIQPGGFLTAVIEGDLFEAVRRYLGDVRDLKAIVEWFDMNAPATCFGSKRARERWQAARAEERANQ